MQVFILLLAWLQLAPSHDFHTTILNFNYVADEKSYEIDLMVDTEHLTYLINRTYGADIRMGEKDEDPACDSLIEDYVGKHIRCKLNRRNVAFELDIKEVTFAETTLHFKPVRYRWRLCRVQMENDFMLEAFPKQKNLVNLHYKDENYSMLFDAEHRSDRLKID